MSQTDEIRYHSMLLEAEAIGGDYASGYGRGLRRLRLGDRFGTDAEHERMLALDPEDEDRSRADRARGYRDGFAGRRPTWPCRGPGCTRAAVAHGLCSGHYKQQQRSRDLMPLRPVEPLVRIGSLRVSPACAEAVSADRQGAREALETWAASRKP